MTLRSWHILQVARVACVAVFILTGSGEFGLAQSPTPAQPQPVLRLETGMHTAAIRRISVDAQNRYLVTGSDDKTARVWELATGRLLRVLQVPIGAENEGRVYAVAMSPDGELIAVGGWTGYSWEARHSVYLFERATGKLVTRVTGLPDVVHHLAFSHNGDRLAVLMGSGSGLRVYRMSDGARLVRDMDYSGSGNCVDFDRSGWLVTSCDDGLIRLYDDKLKLVTKAEAPGGKRPFSVKFSPDCKRLAVGYTDSTRVDVLAANDLALLYNPDISGVTNGNLGRVAWSNDGLQLFAGGKWNKGGKFWLRCWSERGRGSWVDVPTCGNTILDLAALGPNSVAFGAFDPAWGVVSGQGECVRRVTGETADFRSNWDGFQTNATGTVVQFSFGQRGHMPAVYDLTSRELTPGISASKLVGPRMTAPGLPVTDWKDTTTPKLNGVPLELKLNDRSRSLAITPSGNQFLLGSEWALTCYAKDGKVEWQTPTPGVVWAVNVSGNGKLVLTALSDGTIRWYRATDGTELLAFYPHSDRSRWIAWTPSGFYDATPGSDTLLGWQVSSGCDVEGEFYPIGQFRTVYYRPDVVNAIVRTLDEVAAVKEVFSDGGQMARSVDPLKFRPPVVELLAGNDSIPATSGTVGLRYSVRMPSGEPVTRVKALVDGRPVVIEPISELQPGAATINREIQIPVPARDCEVSLIAENRFAPSQPVSIQVNWKGNDLARPVTAEVIKPRLWMLSVGVSDYPSKNWKLANAAKDAGAFAETLAHQEGGYYREVHTKVLTNEAATGETIRQGLQWLKQNATTGDIAVVFLAGHSLNDPLQRYFFLPFDARLDKLATTGVQFSDVKNVVEVLPCKVLFLVDTSHNDAALGTKIKRGTADLAGVATEMAGADSGGVMITSAMQTTEESGPSSVFVKALVEGFNGKASANGNGTITVSSLTSYIIGRVQELTNGKQTPTAAQPQSVPDFAIAAK